MYICLYRSKSHTLSHVDNPGFHACAILRPLRGRPYLIKGPHTCATC